MAPSQEYLRECDAVLAAFRAAAIGKRWQAYKDILVLRAHHFRDLLDSDAHLQALHDATTYDPADEACLYEYLTALLSRGVAALDAAQCEQVRTQIAAYRAQTKLLTTRIAIINAYVSAATQTNAFADALHMLCSGGAMPPYEFRTLLDMVRAMLDATNLAQIRAYHKALTALAIKQPPTPNGAKTIAYLLSEQRKLEMLMPELKQAEPAAPAP
jgi:hypothetical protein